MRKPISKQSKRGDSEGEPVGRFRGQDPWDIPKKEAQDALIAGLIHDVARLRRITFDQYVKPFGVTRSRAWILARLRRYDGTNQTDLAELLDIGKAAMGSLLDGLERDKFVERKPDPTDGRARRVFLTKKGAQLVKNMRSSSMKISDSVLRGLTYEDRSMLASFLETVRNNLLEMRRSSQE